MGHDLSDPPTTTDTLTYEPAPRVSNALGRALAAATSTTVYDHWGSIWSSGPAAWTADTVSASSLVEEWHVPGRAPGQALAVVRVTHPRHGIDIVAIEHPDDGPVARLLRAVEHTLDQQADDSLPVDVDRLLGDHARTLHGRHCAAVHGDVRDTVNLLGAPPEMTVADMLRDVRGALRLLGGA